MKSKSNKILLFLGYLVSSMGDKIYFISLTMFIINKFNHTSELGKIMSIASLPQLFFGFFAGQLVDKFKKKNIIVVSDFLRGFLMIDMMFFLKKNILDITGFCIITFIVSSIGVFFDPAIAALIPQICEREDELQKINSGLYTLINISTVIGPLVGAMLYRHFDFFTIVGINAFSYIISGLSELQISTTETFNIKLIRNIRVFDELTSGIKTIYSHFILRKIIMLSVATNFLFIPFFELFLPFMIKKELQYDELFYGTILTIRALGTMIASFILYKISIKQNLERLYKKTIFIQGSVVFSIGLIVAFCQTFTSFKVSILIYLLIFTAGFISAISNIPLNVIIQENAPSNRIATTFSTMSTLFRVLAPITLFLFGNATYFISSSTLSIVSGILVMSITIIFSNHQLHASDEK